MMQKSTNKAIVKLDQEYFRLRKQFQTSPDITPFNIEEEKVLFFKNWDKGQRYNPQFQYAPSDHSGYVSKIESLKTQVQKIEHSLAPFYLETIEATLDWINHFNRRNDNDFIPWLGTIYGQPNETLFEQAATFCLQNKETKVKEPQNLSPQQAAAQIKEGLAHYGFTSWKVEVTQMATRMSVNSIQQKIKINKDKYFSDAAIQRLLIHEIGTHVFRNENGKKQPYQLFQFGLPGYLETEEGLAIWSEWANGLRSNRDAKRYCVRLMACYQCFKMDFYDLYNYVNQFLGKNTSFAAVTRIKRGMRDTSLPGGYTKDQVYYKGFLKIRTLDNKMLTKLYIGKIGIEHLSVLGKMEEINWSVSLPKWIQNALN